MCITKVEMFPEKQFSVEGKNSSVELQQPPHLVWKREVLLKYWKLSDFIPWIARNEENN